MNDAAFYKRIEGIFRPQALRKKKVCIVGQGSGGCRVSTELGRLGVALVLIDRPNELLEEHNIIRHVLGYASLHKKKVTEVARHIKKINPSTPVRCVELDVTAEQPAFRELLQQERPDVIVGCTDNEQSKHAIDQEAVRYGIPTVGAGVYNGGIGGEVFKTRPAAACYGCIAAHLQLQRRTMETGQNIDYNNLNVDEIRSTCALNIDIEQIALIHTRVALNLLLAGESDLLSLPPEVNLLVFSNRIVPGVFERPLHCNFYHVPKDSKCLTCGPKTIAESDADRILTALGKPPGQKPNEPVQ
jgi:molybdopterin/thiamine biosynthesis adenylyltransferase